MANVSLPVLFNNSAPPSGISSSSSVDYVGYVYVPLLVIVGIVGNSLTVRVMASVNFRNLPVSKLLIAMSLSDMTINLLLPFNQLFLRQLIGTDLRALSPAGCKLYFWAYRFARQTSSWMVVTISCERFVAVWLHVQAKRINTIRNAYVIIVVVYGIFALYFAYISTLADVIIKGVCISSKPPPGMEKIFNAFIGIGLGLYYFGPSALLIVLNSMVAYKLVVLAKKKLTQVNVSSVTGSLPCPGDGHKKAKRLNITSRTSFMLLCVTTSFVILVAPNAVSHLVSYIKKENVFETMNPALVVIRKAAEIMEQLNHSVNIVLYVLSSKRFRTELITILKGKKPAQRSNISQSMTINMASAT